MRAALERAPGAGEGDVVSGAAEAEAEGAGVGWHVRVQSGRRAWAGGDAPVGRAP